MTDALVYALVGAPLLVLVSLYAYALWGPALAERWRGGIGDA